MVEDEHSLQQNILNLIWCYKLTKLDLKNPFAGDLNINLLQMHNFLISSFTIIIMGLQFFVNIDKKVIQPETHEYILLSLF